MRRVIQLADDQSDYQEYPWMHLLDESCYTPTEIQFQQVNPEHRYQEVLLTDGTAVYIWSKADPKPSAGEMIIVESVTLRDGLIDYLHIEDPCEE